MGKKGKQVTFCLKYINQSFKDRYDQNLDKDFLKIKILSDLLESLYTSQFEGAGYEFGINTLRFYI